MPEAPDNNNKIVPETRNISTHLPEGIIDAQTLQDRIFPRMELRGEWQRFMGKLTVEPFSWLIYGSKGSGKSTFVIRTMKYFAEEHGLKILFVAQEEQAGATLKDKFERTKAFSPNIHISNKMVSEQIVRQYDMLVIDSINSLGMSPDEFDELRKAGKKYGYRLLGIFQANVDGTMKGGSRYAHDVDIVTIIEAGIAQHEKNRYGGEGLMRIFNSTNIGIEKYPNLSRAKTVADKKRKKGQYAKVVMGSDRKYWVVNFQTAMELQKKGYILINE